MIHNKLLNYFLSLLPECRGAVGFFERYADELCPMFEAERLTFYVVSADGKSLEARIQTGLKNWDMIKLPLHAGHSVAAYAGRTIEMRDGRIIADSAPPAGVH